MLSTFRHTIKMLLNVDPGTCRRGNHCNATVDTRCRTSAAASESAH
jgi:hypothetical protein